MVIYDTMTFGGTTAQRCTNCISLWSVHGCCSSRSRKALLRRLQALHRSNNRYVVAQIESRYGIVLGTTSIHSYALNLSHALPRPPKFHRTLGRTISKCQIACMKQLNYALAHASPLAGVACNPHAPPPCAMTGGAPCEARCLVSCEPLSDPSDPQTGGKTTTGSGCITPI
jgi:hypothetical protein